MARDFDHPTKNQQAISFSSDLGAFEGSPNNVFVIEKNNKRQSIQEHNKILNKNRNTYNNNSALMHVLSVKDQFNELKKILRKAKGFNDIPGSAFNNQIITLLQVVSSNHPVSLFKLHLGSFDTHKNQVQNHTKLLEKIGCGNRFFRKPLKAERFMGSNSHLNL